MKKQKTTAEILEGYCAKKQSSRNLAEAIEALHPFAVSRIAQFCDSDFDHDYVKSFKWPSRPVYLLGEALTAPASCVPPVEKAKVWIHYIAKNDDDIKHYLARLVAKKVPGFKEFQNLSPDCFYAIIHPLSQGYRLRDERAKSRTEMEGFLRGTDASPASTIAFLQAARKDSRGFSVREMFLYSCAHCRSVKQYAFIVKNLKPKLGKANFVDALGYSPFFYVAFGHDQHDIGKFAKWLVEGDGRQLCDLIRKAGGHPERKCRYGFSWKDLETAAAAIVAESGGDARTNNEDDGDKTYFISTAAPDPLPIPSSASDIRQTLIDDPDRGVAAILAMDYEPASLEKPFGPRERILSAAICDRSIPKPTRVRLLRLCEDAHFAGIPPPEAKGEVPLGFLNSYAGRRWMSENGRPGCEFVRCWHPTFFKNVLPSRDDGSIDDYKLKYESFDRLEPSVKKAIAGDSPSQLMMPLSVAGKSVDTRLLSMLLHFRKKRILEWLIENDDKTRKSFGPREMLFYVCKHWFGDDAVEWLEKAEKKEPGILKSCVDPLGCNLLWYSDSEEVAETLLKHGCDPDAETVWGLSWRDRSECKNKENPQVFDVTVNGKPLPEIAAAILNQNFDSYGRIVPVIRNRNFDSNAGIVSVDTVRIVMPENGRTFEWKTSEHFRSFTLAEVDLDEEPVPSFSMLFRVEYLRDRDNNESSVSVCFDLDPDGIVRVRKV